MAWYDFLTAGTAKVIDSVGGIIDDMHTSDDEKLKAKAVIQKLLNAHDESQRNSVANYDKEISARHKNDMHSDSWLSKNVRPLVLVFLTVSTVILAYATIFALDVKEVALVMPWVNLLQVLLVTCYTFYFGSRGWEKIQKIKKP